MRYRTHVASTFALSVPLLLQTNTFTIASAAALAVGSIFPDIDEPHSYIGSRTRGLSDVIGGIFGHRGITHGLVGLLVSTLTFYLANHYLGFDSSVVWWFSLGYFAHLVEDSFSKSGVAWLQPLSKESLQFGFNKLYYVTGSLTETILMYAFMAALFLQVTTLDLPLFYIYSVSFFILSGLIYEFRKALNILKLTVIGVALVLLSTTAYAAYNGNMITNAVSQQSANTNESISKQYETFQGWWEDSTLQKIMNFNKEDN